jgi:actin related protein 2/3 complex, subunit 2
MSIRCWDELVKFGALDLLKREYGDWLQAQPEPDYNVSLEYAIESVPPPGGLVFPHTAHFLDQ